MNHLFQLEGVTLPQPLPPSFERFYRAKLRRVFGSRLRSSSLMLEYKSWASANGESGISYALLARSMAAIGHGKLTSNGVQYCDVGFASDYPDTDDTLPDPFVGTLPPVVARRTGKRTPDLIARVDAALVELLEIRKALCALAEPTAPHLAAQFTLGIG